MSTAMHKASAILKDVAKGLDKIFETATGERMSWSLMVWPRTGDERANYISNCPRPETIKALEELLACWKAGMPDVPGHEVN